MLTQQGDLAVAQADFARAHACYGQSLQIAQQLDDTLDIATGLECLASVAGAQADAHHAARLLGTAERLRTHIGIPICARDQPRTQQGMTAARAQLGDNDFAAAWAAGQALTLEQAITEALQATK